MKLLFLLSNDVIQCDSSDLLNWIVKSEAFSHSQIKMSDGIVFNFGYNTLDLHGLKYELKPIYAADFAKQESSIQIIPEILRELKLTQALAEVTKLQRLILTIPATSTSYKRSLSSLKREIIIWCVPKVKSD